MFRNRRLAAAIASGLLVMGIGALGAPAVAEDTEAPDEVTAPADAGDWPELVEGDSRWEVSTVKFLLVEYGFLDVNHATEDFGERLAESVVDYQAARGLEETAAVDAATWAAITDDLGLVRQGDSGNRVKAVQQALISGYGYALLLDGEFGPATRGAVVEFQSIKCLTTDGIVGPATFEALVTNPDQTCD